MPKKVPAKTKDIPATHGMLLELRDELKNEIKSSTKRLEASIEAGFKRTDADIAELKSLFHQAMLRFEEQRSENKVVLEALHGLGQRQDRLESEFVEVRDTTRALAKAKSPKGRA